MGWKSNILVLGDSYADKNRFNAGIARAFEEAALSASVESIALIGRHSQQILDELPFLHLAGFDAVLILSPINDIVQRRGAGPYARTMRRLAESGIAPRMFILEMIHCDETADISRLLGRIKHRLQSLRDPFPGRIERYRAALALEPVEIIETQTFLPAYDPTRFSDGLHLIESEYERLAHHAGRQMVRALRPVREPW